MSLTKLVGLVMAFSLLGCATSGQINHLSLGMTKQDVIRAMGMPTSTSATEGVEYLNYQLSETDDDAFRGITSPYFVRIKAGIVDAFGRLGDFDSTKPRETKSTIDLNVNEAK